VKGRTQIRLLCSSQANAETVRGQLQAWLNGRADRWQVEGTDPFVYFDRAASDWTVGGDLGFTTTQGADDLLALVESRWTTGPIASLILSGSSVWIHDCQHDVQIGACAVRQESVKP
jgi:hypothetical protein